MFWLLILGASLLLVTAILLGRKAKREETAAGLGRVRVVYSDSGAWEEVATPLFAERYNLTGKPDYIVRNREGLVAVEVKPLRRAAQPYESDIMQLAAYCLLLEEDWGESPAYGLLRYADKTFRVEWEDELRQELLVILDEMRELMHQPALLGEAMPEPQHDMTVRCRACGFQYICWPNKKAT